MVVLAGIVQVYVVVFATAGVLKVRVLPAQFSMFIPFITLGFPGLAV
jgi:hypothetical protein